MQQGGFTGEAIGQAISSLEERGLLDDLSTARSAVRSRGGRYGRGRIARELAARGFAEETIRTALEDLPPDEEEKALARAFAKLRKSHAGLPREKRASRVWNALLSRGFLPDRISAIMKGSDEVD